MSSTIQAKFNEYQTKYPLYNRDALVDLMVEDGVISTETAKRIKAGESLFLIDSNLRTPNANNDFSMTNILGGNFTTRETQTKPVPETNFNQEIENTFQSPKQGDCWLLSDINAMKQTKWGREAIKNAIIPDGQGGVTIRFKGSPLPQKNFHITAHDIQNAKDSGKYSTGDDDMIALELATERVIIEWVNSGRGERVDAFDDVIGYKSYLTGAYLDKNANKNIDISTLLTGVERIHADFSATDENEKQLLKPEKVLKYVATKQDEHSIVCTFNHFKDMFGARAEDDPVHGNHAYAIKKITYGKEVIVIDPYHTDKEIKLSWDKFIEDVESLYISSPNEESRKELEEKAIGTDYAEAYQANLDRMAASREESLQNLKNIEDAAKQRKIDEKLDKCLKYNASWELLEMENQISYKSILSTMKSIDKDIVVQVLEQKPDLILKLDKYQSGLGKGEKKKALISPIIDALVEKAKEANIDQNVIDEFRTKCYKELDAMFHTDEQILQQQVETMTDLIKAKK